MLYRKQLALEFASEGWQGIPNMIGKLLKSKEKSFYPANQGKSRSTTISFWLPSWSAMTCASLPVQFSLIFDTMETVNEQYNIPPAYTV